MSGQALADLKPGDPVRIVEHDDSTRQPKPGGEVIPATVLRVTDGGAYFQVRTERYGVLSFWRESGWHAWDNEFRWRLFPGAAGESRVCEACGGPLRGGEGDGNTCGPCTELDNCAICVPGQCPGPDCVGNSGRA